MKHSRLDVLILKPTTSFLSLLTALRSDVSLPDLLQLQTDTTAYTIRKQPNEEAMLAAIEQNYQRIFKHEIGRWLGSKCSNDIEISFLDFLCSFKFEFHSQILLMEPSVEQGHQVLCIKPRSVLVKWMESSVEDKDQEVSILERLNLSRLVDDATVVIRNFDRLSEVKTFLKHHYRPLFKVELSRMCERVEQWPDVDTIDVFNHYFSVEPHTQLIHLR